MSDTTSRALQRRVQQFRSPTDEAAWLTSQLRAGRLDRSRLELAVHLGHRAALLATGRDASPDAPAGWVELRAWSIALERWGADVTRRAAIAEARQWVVEAQQDVLGPGAVAGRVVSQRLDACVAWVLTPTPAARAHLDDLITSEPELPAFEPGASGEAATRALLMSALLAGHVLATRSLRPADWWPGPEALEGRPHGPVVRLRRAVKRALVPWALGTGDPLLDDSVTALDRLELASPCTADWSAMKALDADRRKRWCGDCGQVVHDLSALDRAEALALLSRGGERPCLRLFRRTDETVLLRDCPDGLRRRAEALPRPELDGHHLLGGWSW